METLWARLFGSLYIWIISNVANWITIKLSLVSTTFRPIMQDVSVMLGVMSGIVLFISSIQLMKKRKLDMERQKLEIEKEMLEIAELRKRSEENESD